MYRKINLSTQIQSRCKIFTRLTLLQNLQSKV